MGDFTDKVVLIAGALGTLGVDIAENFRSKGAIVLIAPGASYLAASGAGFIMIDGEVGDPDNLALRCKEIEARHGRLDLVIFCSGTAQTQRMEDVPAFNPQSKPPTLLRRLCAVVMAIL